MVPTTTIDLHVERREILGKKVKALRRHGQVPGVLHSVGLVSTPIQAEQFELERALLRGASRGLVTLYVGDDPPTRAVMRRLSRVVTTGKVSHFSLVVVSDAKKFRASVPIRLTGVASAVEAQHGVLHHNLRAVEVECFPEQLPREFVLDLSTMTAVRDAIRVRDITCPADVQLLTDPEQVIANVSILRRGEVPVAAPEELPVADATPSA